MSRCRIAMVQMNSVVGDLMGNVRSMEYWLREACRAHSDIVVFPELAITGYPPEDLVLRPSFLKDTRDALEHLRKRCRQVTVVVGFIEEYGNDQSKIITPLVSSHWPRNIFNSAAVIHNKTLVATHKKIFLPNYGVFDESRYFQPGKNPLVLVVNGVRVGVNICEDIWHSDGPTCDQVKSGGAELIININASPYHMGKNRAREHMLIQRARENRVILSYTNMVGGQDEIVFDGNSLLVDHAGKVMCRAKAFEEDLLISDLNIDGVRTNRVDIKSKMKKKTQTCYSVKRVIISKTFKKVSKPPIFVKSSRKLNAVEEVYNALVIGVRDYVRKNGFHRVLIGISGGIDSALTAAIATDALGSSNVLGVFMPSPFTSRESRVDSRALMKALRIQLMRIPITKIWRQYLKVLFLVFGNIANDTTEENLQARIRGTILMALSNKFGHLVLTTGNKSEMSVGYATLYGDMAGGFAVIKDVPKTLVYDLARYRNNKALSECKKIIIPQRIIDRPPSAELKPYQTDQDTLPPYEMLDPILEAYVEEDYSVNQIAEMGFKVREVKRVMAMVDSSEYKRRQSPIGIKITSRAFGKDRRMPITNCYMKH